MIVLALDPGARTGIATAVNGVLDLLADADGLADTVAILRTLPKPDRIVIEIPTRDPKSKIDDYGTLRESCGQLVAVCYMLWGPVPILRPWPKARNGQRGWQEIRAGYTGDSKAQSVAFVADHLRRHGRDPSVLRTARGRVRHDAADAGVLAVWGSLQ
jgi:hypothetical protein